jgi:hypothetical protein
MCTRVAIQPIGRKYTRRKGNDKCILRTLIKLFEVIPLERRIATQLKDETRSSYRLLRSSAGIRRSREFENLAEGSLENVDIVVDEALLLRSVLAYNTDECKVPNTLNVSEC